MALLERNNVTSCALRVWGIAFLNFVASASTVPRLANADGSMVGALIGDFCADAVARLVGIRVA